jgi:hypothetical protein
MKTVYCDSLYGLLEDRSNRFRKTIKTFKAKNIHKYRESFRQTLKMEFSRKCSALGERVPLFHHVQTNNHSNKRYHIKKLPKFIIKSVER